MIVVADCMQGLHDDIPPPMPGEGGSGEGPRGCMQTRSVFRFMRWGHYKTAYVNMFCVFYSMSGHRVINSANTHFYTATKFATTAMTEGLRQELRERKSNIKVTVGYVWY